MDEKEKPWDEDEIDLYELWEVMIKRKWLIIGLFLIFVIGAIIYSLTLPKVYEVKTVLTPKLLLSLPDNLKITSDDIKALFEEEIYLKQVFDEEKGLPTLLIEIGKKTNMVNITYKTSKPKKGVGDINKLLEVVYADESMLREARDFLDIKMDNIKSSIVELKEKLSFYDIREQDIKTRMNTIDKEIALLNNRINILLSSLGNVNINFAKVLSYTNMIKSLQSERSRMVSKYYDLRSEKEKVKNTIIGIEKSITDQNITLTKVEKDIKNLGMFDIVVKPYYVNTPVGPKKKLIVGVAGISALFFGIFLVFFLEFLERGKKIHKNLS